MLRQIHYCSQFRQTGSGVLECRVRSIIVHDSDKLAVENTFVRYWLFIFKTYTYND